MDIKSISAPAIGEDGVRRLYTFTHPKPMRPPSVEFQAGYEQAKRDFRRALEREVIIPNDELRNKQEEDTRPPSKWAKLFRRGAL